MSVITFDTASLAENCAYCIELMVSESYSKKSSFGTVYVLLKINMRMLNP